jgi:hypothetical protein
MLRGAVSRHDTSISELQRHVVALADAMRQIQGGEHPGVALWKSRWVGRRGGGGGGWNRLSSLIGTRRGHARW